MNYLPLDFYNFFKASKRDATINDDTLSEMNTILDENEKLIFIWYNNLRDHEIALPTKIQLEENLQFLISEFQQKVAGPLNLALHPSISLKPFTSPQKSSNPTTPHSSNTPTKRKVPKSRHKTHYKRSKRQYWTHEEHQSFLKALDKYGTEGVNKIAKVLKKDKVHVKTHLNTYLLNKRRRNNLDTPDDEEDKFAVASILTDLTFK